MSASDEHLSEEPDEAKKKEERRQTRLGCGFALALVVAAVSVTVLIVGGGDDAGPPAPVELALAWYEGGTLHAASPGQWLSASRDNRLATSADWAATWGWMDAGNEGTLNATDFVALIRAANDDDTFERMMLTLRGGSH